jgi:multidrug resistance efflux pump
MSTGRIILINTLIIIIISAVSIGGYSYYVNAANYIKTEDAKVQGDMVAVTPEVPGTITEWKGSNGSTFKKGDVIAKIQTASGTKDLVAPIDGTIVQSTGNDGATISPLQPVAQMVDMNSLYVVANIEETSLEDLSNGQEVDVTVDASPASKIKGTVKEIGMVTNSVFSLLKPDVSSGTYTKVTQKIPVKISLENYPEEVVPGMNATVWIHK